MEEIGQGQGSRNSYSSGDLIARNGEGGGESEGNAGGIASNATSLSRAASGYSQRSFMSHRSTDSSKVAARPVEGTYAGTYREPIQRPYRPASKNKNEDNSTQPKHGAFASSTQHSSSMLNDSLHSELMEDPPLSSVPASAEPLVPTNLKPRVSSMTLESTQSGVLLSWSDHDYDEDRRREMDGGYSSHSQRNISSANNVGLASANSNDHLSNSTHLYDRLGIDNNNPPSLGRPTLREERSFGSTTSSISCSIYGINDRSVNVNCVISSANDLNNNEVLDSNAILSQNETIKQLQQQMDKDEFEQMLQFSGIDIETKLCNHNGQFMDVGTECNDSIDQDKAIELALRLSEQEIQEDDPIELAMRQSLAESQTQSRKFSSLNGVITNKEEEMDMKELSLLLSRAASTTSFQERQLDEEEELKLAIQLSKQQITEEEKGFELALQLSVHDEKYKLNCNIETDQLINEVEEMTQKALEISKLHNEGCKPSMIIREGCNTYDDNRWAHQERNGRRKDTYATDKNNEGDDNHNFEQDQVCKSHNDLQKNNNYLCNDDERYDVDDDYDDLFADLKRRNDSLRRGC